MKILIETDNPEIGKLVVERYATVLGPGAMLSLLKRPEPQIRLTAIKGLKGINDITVLKIIMDAYEKEKDPEVRKAYKETFWMLEKKG